MKPCDERYVAPEGPLAHIVPHDACGEGVVDGCAVQVQPHLTLSLAEECLYGAVQTPLRRPQRYLRAVQVEALYAERGSIDANVEIRAQRGVGYYLEVSA